MFFQHFFILLCREIGQRATSVRSCYDITCSENAVEFLTELGCRLEFEYIAKGFVFRKGRMKITGNFLVLPAWFLTLLPTKNVYSFEILIINGY